MFRSRWCAVLLAATFPFLHARASEAQTFPFADPVQVPPAEVALAISMNGMPTDVNASPSCGSLSFPCTHTTTSPDTSAARKPTGCSSKRSWASRPAHCSLFAARQVIQIDAGAGGHGRFLRNGREMTHF